MIQLLWGIDGVHMKLLKSSDARCERAMAPGIFDDGDMAVGGGAGTAVALYSEALCVVCEPEIEFIGWNTYREVVLDCCFRIDNRSVMLFYLVMAVHQVVAHHLVGVRLRYLMDGLCESEQ
jgi:hypothetical protein